MVESLDSLLSVKTGQDLLDKGVVAKSSSQDMALLTVQRLRNLRDSSKAGINEFILGKWDPLFVEKEDEERHVLDVEENSSEAVKLYRLSNGVSADYQTGHFVRLSKDLPYNDDTIVPKGATGRIVLLDENNGNYKIVLDQEYGGRGHIDLNLFNHPHLTDHFEVSSLGQKFPIDQEKYVREDALQNLLPRAILTEDVGLQYATTLIMGRDFVIDGPPGTGKTLSANDIASIAQVQEAIFTVEGCQVQCHPASIFDPEGAKDHGLCACPECKQKFDDNYIHTGRFTAPKPEDVSVVVGKYGEGEGIERIQGGPDLDGFHLVGAKIPRLSDPLTKAITGNLLVELTRLYDEKAGEENGDAEREKILDQIRTVLKELTEPDNDYDPRGFKPGSIVRTNSGILIVDEIEKCRTKPLDYFLSAIQDEKVFPDSLRHSYPANALIIATSNDYSKISEPLRDRLIRIRLERPNDPDVVDMIDRESYHQEARLSNTVEGEHVHNEEPIDLRRIPMPEVVRMATARLYFKFDSSYDGKGKEDIMGGNRCRNDANDAARARLVIDKIFHEETTPKIANEDYARSGIAFAMAARISTNNSREYHQSKTDIEEWVDRNYTSTLEEVSNKFWCGFNKEMAQMKREFNEIENYLVDELSEYEANSNDSFWRRFEEVHNSAMNPEDDESLLVASESPFMQFLYRVQPRMSELNKNEVIELGSYMLNNYKGSECFGELDCVKC